MADINTLPGANWSNVTIPGSIINAGSILGSALSADQRREVLSQSIPTVPTAAGTTEILFVIPVSANVSAVKVVFKDALAAHDTNYVAFAVVNKGTGGVGTAKVVDDTVAANTTRITGGSAIAGYVQRTLTLTVNIAVANNAVLALQIIGNGTLANTLTEGRAQIHLDTAT